MTNSLTEALLYLLQNIVTHPDEVSIDESHGENSQIILTVHVNKEDMGVVIGKQGRIIRAIRDLVKLVAAKNNSYVDVVLAETS